MAESQTLGKHPTKGYRYACRFFAEGMAGRNRLWTIAVMQEKDLGMPRRTERIALKSPAPGTERHLLVHRYGLAGRGRKAYLQAALHADEWPGLLALQHLLRLLDQADAAGRIRGEIVVVPYANPVGMAQRIGSDLSGRYAFDGSGNFNRGWPDFAPRIAARLKGRLTGNTPADIILVRQALREAAAAMPRRTEVDVLRASLAALAVDADIVLDVHCDCEALLHHYAAERHRAAAEALAGDLGAAVTMLSDSAGPSFDESMMSAWWRLGDLLPEAKHLPSLCFACTVELRGKDQIDDDLARADAQGLFNFLQRHDLIAGGAPPLKDPGLVCDLTAVEPVEAEEQGLVVFTKQLGEEAQKGEVIAWLVNPAADNPAEGRKPIFAGQSGLVLSRIDAKLVRPGERIMKIAGTEPLDDRRQGALLED